MLLDEAGKPLTDRLRAKTPNPSTPKAITKIIADFAKQLGEFDRVSVGFPGVIKKGTVYTAANLNKKWIEYPFAESSRKSWASRCAWPTTQSCRAWAAVTGDRRRIGDHAGNRHGLGAVSGRRADSVAGDGPSSFSQWKDLRGRTGTPRPRQSRPQEMEQASARGHRPNCTSCSITTGSTSAAAMPPRSRSSCPITPPPFPIRTGYWAESSCGSAIWTS